MAQSSLQNVLHFARRIAETSGKPQISDIQLLEHFAQHKDHASFAILVDRHGALVWNTCQRVLGRVHDVEDCFQATFLVLARKAQALKQGESLGAWLHRVAFRLAVRSQTMKGRRLQKETRAASMNPSRMECDKSWDDLRCLLDGELEQLPETYRIPLVLCYLQGKSNAQAASELGWPLGTIKGRLVRGRTLLRQRLERRGVTLGVTALAGALAEQTATATVPGVVAASTAVAATAFAAGKATCASARAVSLAGAFLRAAGLGTFLKMVAIVSCLVLATGSSLLLAGPEAPFVAANGEGKSRARRVETLDRPAVRLDAYGDPLPPDAIARLGSSRYRMGMMPRSIDVTPDGKAILADGSDGILRWDSASGRLLSELDRKIAPGSDSRRSFSPDKKRYVAAVESALWVCDSETGAKLATMGEGRYHLACYSPDGATIAATRYSQSGSVELFDAGTGKSLWRSGDYKYGISHLQFTADGKNIVAAGWNVHTMPPISGNFLRVLEAASGKENLAIDLGKSKPWEIALSRDGKLAAVNGFAGGQDVSDVMSDIRVWDLITGKQRFRIQPPGPPSRINSRRYFTSLLFPSDGKTLITGGGNCDQLVVWDLATGKETRRLGQGLGNVSSMTETKDGKTLVSAGEQRIHVIDYVSGLDRTSLYEASARSFASAFSIDGTKVFTGNTCRVDGSSQVVLWDVMQGKESRRIAIPDGCTRLFAADGKIAVVAQIGAPYSIRLRNLENETEKVLLASSAGPTHAYAVNASGTMVAIGDSQKEEIELFESPGGNRTRVFQDPSLTTHQLRFTSDDKHLFAFSHDQTVRVWDMASGKKISQYIPELVPDNRPQVVAPPQVREVPTLATYEIALSPDGKRIASTDLRDFILIRDALDGKNQVRVDTVPERPRVMAFCPSGKLLAWASWDEPAIHILDVASRKEVRKLTGHQGIVLSLEFSRDGRKLVSNNSDCTALVWDFARIEPELK